MGAAKSRLSKRPRNNLKILDNLSVPNRFKEKLRHLLGKVGSIPNPVAPQVRCYITLIISILKKVFREVKIASLLISIR